MASWEEEEEEEESATPEWSELAIEAAEGAKGFMPADTMIEGNGRLGKRRS